MILSRVHYELLMIIFIALKAPSCKLFIVQMCVLYNKMTSTEFSNFTIRLMPALNQASRGKQALALDPLMHGRRVGTMGQRSPCHFAEGPCPC